jgi:hypothetical protein
VRAAGQGASTTVARRTIRPMPTLSVSEVEARMIGLSEDLSGCRILYAVAAENRTRAIRDRDVALALAYGEATGNSTDRRQAAIASVGLMSVDEEAHYSRLRADLEVVEHLVIANAALLKSAKSREFVGRYEDGP